MRVTKVLKEYAEKEINARFNEKLREIKKPIEEIAEARDTELEAIRLEAEEKARAVFEKYGYEYNVKGYGYRYGTSSPEDIFSYTTRYYIHPMSEKINKEENELRTKKCKAIERFILEMELDGDKEKFFEALAAITL